MAEALERQLTSVAHIKPRLSVASCAEFNAIAKNLSGVLGHEH